MIDLALLGILLLMRTRANPSSPTHCEHDVLTVCVDPGLFSSEELARLDELGFIPGEDECFISFQFGSA